MRSAIGTLLSFIFAFAPISASLSASATDHPSRKGYVNDFAGKLPATMIAYYNAQLAAYDRAHAVRIVLVIADISEEVKQSPKDKSCGCAGNFFDAWDLDAEGSDPTLLVFISSDNTRVDFTASASLAHKVDPEKVAAELTRATQPLLDNGSVAQTARAALKVFMDAFASQPSPVGRLFIFL